MPLVHAWNNDGSKLFVGGIGGNSHGRDHDDEILEYSCETDYDVSTCTFTRKMIVNDDHNSGTNPSDYGVNIDMRRVFGMTFNNDGTKIYLNSGAQAPNDCQAGNGPNCRIYEITLGSAFNLSSGTLTNTKSLIISSGVNQDGIPTGITFNNDGSKLFVAGFHDDDIIVYPLSTPYSLASSSVGTPAEYDVSDQSTNPRDIDFNNDGTKMYIVTPAASADHIAVYSLSTAFDLSEGYTHLGNYSVTGQDNQPWSIEFNDVGTKMFMIGYQHDRVNEYSLNTAFELIAADPTLTSSAPTDNATGVALNANIVLTFSENVNVESGNITIFKTSDDDSAVETIDVAGSKVTGDGSTEITINPGTDFDNNTEYYVLIPNTAFDDVDSGSYAGIPTSKTTLSFTTTNAVPTLTSSVPADDATDVERDANIILNFSENVDAETGDIEIYKTSGDVLVETIGVTSGQVTGSGTSQITINPSSNFDSLTEYYVLIDATAFDNSSSGSYAGISSTTELSFTIKAMVDPTTDKNVTVTIDSQNMMAKNTLSGFTSLVNDRLRYLRQNRINKDFTKNNIKLDFGNAMLTSLAKFIPASKIHLTNEILTSLAIDIPTSKTYLTNTMLASLAKVTPASKVYLTDYIPKNWSSWSEGSVSMTKVGDSKNSSSKDIDVQSLALGFDKKLNNNNLLGFAMQFSQSDSEVGTSGTGIDSKNYNLSVYGTRPLNADNFVEGLFGVVLTENELVRKSGSNTLTGSRNGTQIFASINYGKTIDKEDFNLTPIARVDLGYTELDGYTETGTDALTYGKQTVESGLVSIGLEINDYIKFSNSSLEPFGSFQYGLDFSNSSEAKMNYVSDTSTIYSYTPGINSTHLLTAEMGFNYFLQDHLKLTGIFKRIQGSGSQQTNNIRFGFHYISQRETEYAMSLDGSDELMTGLNISKNINGFDIKLGSNYSLMSEIPDYGINLKISNKF